MAGLFRDLIFTPSCIACAKLGLIVCQQCLADLAEVRRDDLANVDELICANPYQGWLRERLIEYKSGNYVLGRGLAQIVIERCLRKLPNVPIVPIPTSSEKLRIRQIDTVGHIAKQIKLISLDSHISPVLQLRKNIVDQVGLSKSQRLENLKNAFICKRGVNGSFILLDDVVTTGATMTSAALALKSAGAKRVYAAGLCAARKLS